MQLRAELCTNLSQDIPLTTSISIVYGQVMRQAIGDFFQKPELTSAPKRAGTEMMCPNQMYPNQ